VVTPAWGLTPRSDFPHARYCSSGYCQWFGLFLRFRPLNTRCCSPLPTVVARDSGAVMVAGCFDGVDLMAAATLLVVHSEDCQC
jgi:hypothetical protein